MRQTGRDIHRDRLSDSGREREREAHRHTDKTDRDRERQRQRARQTHTDTQRHRQTDRQSQREDKDKIRGQKTNVTCAAITLAATHDNDVNLLTSQETGNARSAKIITEKKGQKR